MRREISCLIFISFLILLSGLSARSVAADESLGLTGHIDAVLGMKSLNHSDWAPLDDQIEAGVSADYQKLRWPASLAMNFMINTGRKKTNGVETRVDINELGLGIKKYWDLPSSVSPFVGAGPLIVSARTQLKTDVPGGTLTTSDANSGIGLWAETGFLAQFHRRLEIGFTLRYSKGNVDQFSRTVDAGGLSYLLSGGVHF